MQQVYTIVNSNKKLIFQSENETEVRYVFQILTDYHSFDDSITVTMDDVEKPKFDIFDDFLDVPAYKSRFDAIIASSKKGA